MPWQLPEGVVVDAIFTMDRDPSFTKGNTLYIPDDFAEWYQMHGGWRDIAQCAHDESVCQACLHSWLEDHVVMLRIDGQDINLDELLEDDDDG